MNTTPFDSDNYLTIAVASDLHAFEPSDKILSPPSHLKITLPETDIAVHPISALLDLIKKKELKTDLFLCPGDMGDKANASGIKYAWKAIHQIGTSLEAKLTAAASGNHDLDSRYLTSYDAKGTLLGLVPPYPLPNDAMNNKYWARNYVIVDGDEYRLLILNTSAYHGGQAHEIDHGRIAESTLSFLSEELKALPPKLINILLCHHHPQQHMELELGGYDVMQNGQLLLDLLPQFGRWLVIHGHKHHPKLAYASGGATSPIVFSAGSLCANLYLELQTKARNQFYMIYLPIEQIRTLGLVGFIQAWDWAVGDGWAPAASVNSGLPSRCPFGHRADPRILAHKIATLMTGEKMKWSEVTTEIPEINYLLPSDASILGEELGTLHQLEIIESDGRAFEIGRRQ
jgi:hypothetical protein